MDNQKAKISLLPIQNTGNWNTIGWAERVDINVCVDHSRLHS